MPPHEKILQVILNLVGTQRRLQKIWTESISTNSINWVGRYIHC